MITKPILNGPQFEVSEVLPIAQALMPQCATVERVVVACTTFGALTAIGNIYLLAQFIKETDNGTSKRFTLSNNPAGLGADDSGAWGETFPTIEAGIMAMCAHLGAYAIKPGNYNYFWRTFVKYDPRYAVLEEKKYLGIAPLWGLLNGKWNTPKDGGKGYAETINDIAVKLMLGIK